MFKDKKNFVKLLLSFISNKINIFYKWLSVILSNPIYIKYFFVWEKSLKSGCSALHDGLPWVTFESRDWLFANLKNDMEVFEWGSGGSTIFIAKRVKNLISIEHDNHWFEEVEKTLKENNIVNCNYLLKEAKKCQIHSENRRFKSTDKRYSDLCFEDYCNAINNFSDKKFDLIFIDGRSRPTCIELSINKVKPSGYIVVDNSDREEYFDAMKLMNGWKKYDFYGFGPYVNLPWKTTVFKCPS